MHQVHPRTAWQGRSTLPSCARILTPLSNTGSLNDLYIFNLATYEWTAVDYNYTAGNPPSPRDSFGSGSVDSVVYIFGGENSDNGAGTSRPGI